MGDAIQVDNVNYNYQVGFIANVSAELACKYAVIVKTDENLCEHPFTLPDGVTYQWHGCEGGTWVTWGNNQLLWYCSAVPENWTCNGVIVQRNWLCGP
jgi:hypothetical protein